MKICVLSARELELYERDGKTPACAEHRHVHPRDVIPQGSTAVLTIAGRNAEGRFVGEGERRMILIDCRHWAIVGQTQRKPRNLDSPRYMKPGAPSYQMVPV